MRKKIHSALVLLTLFIVSCKKDRTLPVLSLPAITETGQNTLGFLLDNKVWSNHGRRCTIAGCRDNKVRAHLYKGPNGNFELDMRAGHSVMSEKIDQSFSFYAENVTSPGTFYLDSSLNSGMTFIADLYTQSFKEYRNKFPNTCVLTITRFDTTAKVISGRFRGTLFNPFDSNDSVIIADGRFDAQLE